MVSEDQVAKWIIKGHDGTPILSTSILSRPNGPSELLIMFAIDCAATTGAGMRDFTHEKR